MKRNCVICKSKFLPTVDIEVFFCLNCQHYQYFGEKNKFNYNHKLLSESLSNLRIKNAKKIVKKLKNLFEYSYVLEVGAGKGYLINQIKKLSPNVYALDYDETFKSELNNLNIGFIKANLEQFSNFENYSTIVGSHVFEHLVDPNNFLKNAHTSKVKNIVLIIPNSEGMIFKLAKLLLKFNIYILWDRLFQKSSNSPHFHYFSRKSMLKIVENNNYKLVDQINLNMVDFLPNIKRINVTESLIISLFSSVILSFLEVLNLVFKRYDSIAYVLSIK